MNILNRVTLKTLKKNRTRTIVTIIGTVLSAAMICAVTTFAASFQGYMLDRAVYENGDWYGSAENVAIDKVTEVMDAPEVKAAAVSLELGYASLDGLRNDYKPYVYIMGADDSFFQIMPVHLTSGRLPENENEIILPGHLSSDGGVAYALDDTITLNIGRRTQTGEDILRQNNPYDPEYPEEIVDTAQRTFTVVGFYERPNFEDYSAPGYTAITALPGTAAGGSNYTVHFKLNNSADVYSFMEEHDLGASTNWEVLTFSGVSRYDGFYSVLYGMAAIVIALIVFGSVSLIYNAFAISVSERTKQFGLLSSVGATKKQIRRSVLFESLLVSVIGIPVGVLCGIGGIGMTLYLIRDKMQIFMGTDIPMRLTVSVPSVIIACAVALLTVLISAWIPSRRATRVSAVEAIRLSHDIAVRAKDVKTSKLTYKLFGFEGALAQKHFRRNRKSYRATIISLFMSIVLFISASSFCLYLTESVEGPFGSPDYDLSYYYYPEQTENPDWNGLYSALKGAKNITESIGQELYVRMLSFGENSSSKAFDDYLLATGQIGEDAGLETLQQEIDLIFIEDSEYERFLGKSGLDVSSYMDAENPLGVLYDNNTRFDYNAGKYYNYSYLSENASSVTVIDYKEIDGYYRSSEETDENGSRVILYAPSGEDATEENMLRIPESEADIKTTYQIGARVENAPFSVWGQFALLYPMSARDAVTGGDGADIVSMCFRSSDHNASYDDMKQILEQKGQSSGYLFDMAADQEGARSTVFVIKVFSYGFIVLISLIAVANVFNTISTNVGLRRREFAMLKSVGMTQKGFNKMMNYECALYGLRSLVTGLPVSFGVTYLIYRAVNSGFTTYYHVPWSAVGIAVFSVFAIVFISMIYSMNKIRKDNPIDALKNENL